MSKYQVDQGIWLALTLGWLAQLVSILVDAFAIGLPQPRAQFGFAPLCPVTTWLVLAVYAIESHRLRLPHIRRALAVLAAGTVVLALGRAGQAHPVHGSMGALHWLTGFASYGLFGAALLHAAIPNQAERQLRNKSNQHKAPTGLQLALGMPLLKLRVSDLPFRWRRICHADADPGARRAVFGALALGPQDRFLPFCPGRCFATLLLGRACFGWRILCRHTVADRRLTLAATVLRRLPVSCLRFCCTEQPRLIAYVEILATGPADRLALLLTSHSTPVASQAPTPQPSTPTAGGVSSGHATVRSLRGSFPARADGLMAEVAGPTLFLLPRAHARRRSCIAGLT